MKKLRWFAITLFLLSVVVYALDQNQIRRKTDQTIPKISMDQDEIQVSVKDPEKVWKKGITAYDEKDGDITDSLVYRLFWKKDADWSPMQHLTGTATLRKHPDS